MLRRVLALLAATVAVSVSVVAVQSPANAWDRYISTNVNYYTHGGQLYIYGTVQAVNWGCGWLDCAEARNLYTSVQAINTYPQQVRTWSRVDFSGTLLSVSIPPGGSGSPFGTSCSQPVSAHTGQYVSANFSGVQCHAQTVAAITGMHLWVWGQGSWNGAWDGSSTGVGIDMYWT